MFALGVLNTTVGGQPAFWLAFGVILTYIIINRIIRKRAAGEKPDAGGMLLGIAWLVVFFVGMIRSNTWPNPSLARTLSILAIGGLIYQQYKKESFEAIKWSILGALVLLTVSVYMQWCPSDVFRTVLAVCSDAFVGLINLSHKGTEFMFGALSDQKGSRAYIFAIRVLPNIIFFAALSSILYYLGVLQKIVFVFAYLLNKLKISGAESVSTAANIFLGQTEAPLMIRPYLEKMNRSEILCIMIGGMANTAGSVMAAYVNMLGGDDPGQQQMFALHMLSQSIMSAPAAIVCAKLLFPQPAEYELLKDLKVPKEKLGDNFLDALSIGTTDGLKLAVNVGAMLIVFTAMMYVANAGLEWVGDMTNLNAQIDVSTAGRYKTLSLELILGYVFHRSPGSLAYERPT
ncbi:hypothetical protein MKQ70_05520 [Chitinophaga sedimenti]|nr:nucleoside transporter C-terminal domain-containing protein [Chitinophaga sedimenti]MCK7554491.1 hypothetical protein [Chitinophaga sedimenti]